MFSVPGKLSINLDRQPQYHLTVLAQLTDCRPSVHLRFHFYTLLLIASIFIVVTQIEALLFENLRGPQADPFVATIAFRDQTVSVEIVSFSDRTQRIRADFQTAMIEAFEFDEDDTIDWPMDIIGFDCYEVANRWRFVLHCTEAEWVWQSDWPIVQKIQ